MAGTELRVATVDRIGTTSITTSILGNSLSEANWFENTGNEVVIANHSSSGGTCYFHIIQRVDGELPEPKPVDVTNSDEHIVGPFPLEIYGNPVRVWADDDYITVDIIRVGG